MRRSRLVSLTVLALLTLTAACSSTSTSPAGGGATGGPSGGVGGGGGGGAGGAGAGGGGGGGGAGATSAALFPLVTPPVRAAAPAGFGSGASHAMKPGRFLTLSSGDIKSRFFQAGPTNIFNLLGAIDDRISGYAQRVQQSGAPSCMSQAPVAYTLHPASGDVPFFAQCYESIGSQNPADPGFVQFGQKDGVTYYYSAVGAGWTAAILTPITAAGDGGDAGSAAPSSDASAEAAAPVDADGGVEAGAAPAAYRVHAWSGVGYLNASGCGDKSGFDDCSYGVIELTADPSAMSFEMAVAGIGFGYCGAQLKSDGAVVYGTGSPDMGTTCADTGTFCVQASDVTTAGSCTGEVATFTLTPLGRLSATGPNAGGPGAAHDAGATWAASQYPGPSGNQVTLDGTSSDSLYFGPTAPTAGVGSFR